jgi:hypothetical protein
VLIHAEAGADYSSPKSVVLGYLITDSNDRVVQRRAGNSTLRPVLAGRPSPLQVTTSVTLDPGDYTMKLAVADGDRVGSVEHRIRAAIDPVGTVSFSDLVVGGTAAPKPALPPPVGATVRQEYLQGTVEAYGADAAAISGQFEIAASADGPAVATAPVSAIASGRDRAVLSQVLRVRALAPGRYVLRAVLSGPKVQPRTLIRAFEIP